MHEQNNTPPEEPTAHQDAIDINDFVFAATGARMRRLTTPDGEHWFVAADAATDLGYANTRQALIWHVAPDCTRRLEEIAQGVYAVDASRKLAAHRLQKSMKMVNLRGLIALVNVAPSPNALPSRRGSPKSSPPSSATAPTPSNAPPYNPPPPAAPPTPCPSKWPTPSSGSKSGTSGRTRC
ncbi:BRO-N domain-containing protein [Streptomyces europaeiscabiei]|uniref:BRO-N domain-containing protein n=1 Tax=Streptomyces europaeiscabiei TaxID=146819 RepID=UPI0038F7032A